MTARPPPWSTWVIYGVIFLYYLIATVFPIDAIIGRIYPIFGAILMFSAIGVFIGIFLKGYPLLNVWDEWVAPMGFNGADPFNYKNYFDAQHFLPVFFVTVACGILSGFHSTQTAIITRTMKSERQGPHHLLLDDDPGGLHRHGVGCRCHGCLQPGPAGGQRLPRHRYHRYRLQGHPGPRGGIIALLGVIVLPVTSGDTALRALRLTVSENFHMDQSSNAKASVPGRAHVRAGGRHHRVGQVQL